MSTNRTKPIYLDYAATTPILSVVRKAMMPFLSSEFGNAGSLHGFGQRAMAAIDVARETVAKAIGAKFEQIVFTGSATEANNLVLRGAVKIAQSISHGTGRSSVPATEATLDLSMPRLSTTDQARDISETFRSKKIVRPRIIILAIEHDSVLQTAKDLERDGVEVIYLPVDLRGVVDLRALKESLNERTILVSVMYVSNEIGTIQPIAEIGKIIKKFKERSLLSKKSDGNIFPLFHTDAVQAFRYLDCNIIKLGVDAMTLSAHKIGGPKGMGMLYTNIKLSPIITGGGQESGMRSGTENVAGIVGFGVAVAEAVKSRIRNFKRVEKLRNDFAEGLRNIVRDIQWNGPDLDSGDCAVSAPHILNVFFPAHLAEELLVAFDRAGIAVSSGSACSARASKLSHVLSAIGCTTDRIQCSIRFSFGPELSPVDTKEALRRIREAL